MAGIDSSISIEMDSYNTEEVEKLHRLMNARALRKKRIRKTVLVCVNILFALFMLFPLLYSVSVSIMPGDELFTMDLNILPSNPTFENYVRAFTQVPLVRFILNSFWWRDVSRSDRSLPAHWRRLRFLSWNLKVRTSCLCW